MEIKKEDFKAYVKVQMSGVTNMFDVPVVCRLSGLDREQVIHIMKHYDEFSKKYPEVKLE